jgi:hypothetical protein
MTRPREEWHMDVLSRYRALEQFTKEEARIQFLRILRSLPYGNSVFFLVKRIEDPIGLLPPKLILGINKRGVHFFRCVAQCARCLWGWYHSTACAALLMSQSLLL